MAALLPLAGCAGDPGPGFAPPGVPAAFRAAAAAEAAPALPADGAWWQVFGDPVLDDLVARATSHNLGLKQAEARLAQARALQRAAAARLWPTLGLTAEASRRDGTLTNAAATTGPLYVLGTTLGYELDLFDRLGREGDAAALDAAERERLRAAAHLLLQAEVARSYFLLQALDAEAGLLRGAVESQRRSARLTEGLMRAGLVSELATTRLRAEAEALAAEALALGQRREEAEQALSLLVGEPATGFRLATAPAPATPPSIPSGIPGTVLLRRPDVAAAHHAWRAGELRAAVAADAWLPTLTLNALGGFAAASFPAVFAASAASSGLGALLGLPVLDGGRYRANLAGARAGRDIAAAAYGQQVLLALKEVEEHLAALRWLAAQDATLARAGQAARRTRDLVAANRARGLASQLEVLDAERVALREERQALRIRAARFVATVGLVRALGGGWGA
ncbi:efflux transporter outer membrane subunit [Paracraurococcus ruber]|uniref:efflux transporter outer membrane subunit n=1 Tax=Paracraurococcus ruber TaxID=77675 RepID=UPI0013050F31|nr:efflux transporter outer membrane subunit [Paracraurococcus ruber]